MKIEVKVYANYHEFLVVNKGKSASTYVNFIIPLTRYRLELKFI